MNDIEYAAKHGYTELTQAEHIDHLATLDPPDDDDDFSRADETLDFLTEEEELLAAEMMATCPCCHGEGAWEEANVDEDYYRETGRLAGSTYWVVCPECDGTGIRDFAIYPHIPEGAEL